MGDSDPETVVEAHLRAYNDRDVDEFVACFSEDAVIERLNDGTVLSEGREEIRAEYGELFDAVPDLHCVVVDRVILGQFVVWHERVTMQGETEDALAIYRVENELIDRLWLGGAD